MLTGEAQRKSSCAIWQIDQNHMEELRELCERKALDENEREVLLRRVKKIVPPPAELARSMFEWFRRWEVAKDSTGMPVCTPQLALAFLRQILLVLDGYVSGKIMRLDSLLRRPLFAEALKRGGKICISTYDR